MNRNLRGTLCATTMVLLALAGCSTPVDGDGSSLDEATTPRSEDTGASTPAPGTGTEADRTIDDLDTTLPAGDPCSLLTADQLAEYGITEPGSPRNSAVDTQQCQWISRDSSSVTNLLVHLDDASGGIEGMHEDSATYPFFEGDVEIAGRPAVHLDITVDPVGQCNAHVDLTAEETLVVGVFLSENDASHSDPCVRVDEVAGLMIENLTGGL
ncbi:DUF3558 domain-containing protein [Actinoalloteichus sp. GBA129-24]|uniref:DUF3558 domain-containing protein n=1 Tax=Actinoalloteichus sp. GBA129-24 TaxID=1612551 RepID=UPI0009509C71|nr:DUF3558 domain-containing protein [Actinoalloteichus sp. GBA129-24]APU19596.1 putative DUF3558 family protein [Actinoalloteichus sp. GBA129-24]